jgi:hypothetical protein
MTHYDPWVDYGGAAKIWLAVGLLALAVGVVYAGIRLPLPTRPAKPSKRAVIVTLVAWAAALVALVASVVIYIRHYIQVHQGTAATPLPDHVAPVTFIISARVHLQLPGSQVGYLVSLFAFLILVDITTLLLLRLSPQARVTRATFSCFALMLGVFAIWALAGFGYPSTAVPLTLNIVSKLLAFATVLTLFFPMRPLEPAPDSSRAAASEPMKDPAGR